MAAPREVLQASSPLGPLLHLAAELLRADAVVELLGRGVPPTLRDAMGATALHRAVAASVRASHGSPRPRASLRRIIHALVAGGCPIDATDAVRATGRQPCVEGGWEMGRAGGRRNTGVSLWCKSRPRRPRPLPLPPPRVPCRRWVAPRCTQPPRRATRSPSASSEICAPTSPSATWSVQPLPLLRSPRLPHMCVAPVCPVAPSTSPIPILHRLFLLSLGVHDSCARFDGRRRVARPRTASAPPSPPSPPSPPPAVQPHPRRALLVSPASWSARDTSLPRLLPS